jgi:methyl-accepting chemotaxis protein
VISSGVPRLAFNGHRNSLLQGYFPLITQYRKGGLDKDMGMLYVEYDISHALQVARQSSVNQAIIFAVISLLAAALIGVLLHRLVTRRVNLLTVISLRLAAGDYSARTGLNGVDELSQLGGAFDLMAQRLAENIERQERQRAFLAEAQKIGHFGSWGAGFACAKMIWSDEVSV